MATGSLDANGIWIYGEDDSETTFSGLLNKLGNSVSSSFNKFKILQVVNGTSSTVVSNTTTTYVDTSLTATITPKSASSKILVQVVQYLTAYTTSAAAASAAIKIMRGSTNIWIQDSIQNPSHYLGATQGVATTQSITHLDSPVTTSAVTYKTQFATNAQSGVTWRANANSNNQLMLSSITLFEVAA